ncbi:MAG: ABC transporter ATP-binding protein [Clostridia bacterium]|nr:ABC transporter ATP-binding protein [Clostridia bacterium]
MIQAINIEKSYNGERVLFGVSLNIADGEFVSIMGESGSGKSTLLSILGGFLDADGGQVLLDGEDVSKLSERRLAQIRCSTLGFVFQSYKLIPTLTARDNLLLPAVLGGNSEEMLGEYMTRLTEALGISELLNKFPGQLSGGQCQRVAIARALLYKPKTLILDEPTGALDSEMEKRVMELLGEVNRELGTTIVQVTHSQTVAGYGNRIVYLKDGKIV